MSVDTSVFSIDEIRKYLYDLSGPDYISMSRINLITRKQDPDKEEIENASRIYKQRINKALNLVQGNIVKRFFSFIKIPRFKRK